MRADGLARAVVRQDHFGRLGRSDVGIERPDGGDRDHAADQLGGDDPGTEAGAIPANVPEHIRPTVIAGLAKLVEFVNQYAAPM